MSTSDIMAVASASYIFLCFMHAIKMIIITTTTIIIIIFFNSRKNEGGKKITKVERGLKWKTSPGGPQRENRRAAIRR